MSHYNGVYVAQEVSQSVSAAGTLVELQVPSNVQIEVLRAWVGAAEGTDPVDEIQEVEIYINDAAATGGTGLTEQAVRGSDDAASAVTALGGPTIGATPVSVLADGFHTQNGWLYLPVPEERIRIAGGSTNDNVGIQFQTAPDAAITVSYGIVWGELG